MTYLLNIKIAFFFINYLFKSLMLMILNWLNDSGKFFRRFSSRLEMMFYYKLMSYVEVMIVTKYI